MTSSTGLGLRSERAPVLLALMVTTGLIAIDATILATAIPTITRDLGGFSSFPWLFSIYLLAQAVAVPICSKLTDVVGRKPIILIGDGQTWCLRDRKLPSSPMGVSGTGAPSTTKFLVPMHWYWEPKIARNVERDAETTDALSAAGWTVLRFWEHQKPSEIVDQIVSELPQHAPQRPSEAS